jgi:hypothetical protein
VQVQHGRLLSHERLRRMPIRRCRLVLVRFFFPAAFALISLAAIIDIDGKRGRLTALPSNPHQRSSPILICVLLEVLMIRLRFSNTIPNGTSVPAWAFLDVTVSQHRKRPKMIS